VAVHVAEFKLRPVTCETNGFSPGGYPYTAPLGDASISLNSTTTYIHDRVILRVELGVHWDGVTWDSYERVYMPDGLTAFYQPVPFKLQNWRISYDDGTGEWQVIRNGILLASGIIASPWPAGLFQWTADLYNPPMVTIPVVGLICYLEFHVDDVRYSGDGGNTWDIEEGFADLDFSADPAWDSYNVETGLAPYAEVLASWAQWAIGPVLKVIMRSQWPGMRAGARAQKEIASYVQDEEVIGVSIQRLDTCRFAVARSPRDGAGSHSIWIKYTEVDGAGIVDSYLPTGYIRGSSASYIFWHVRPRLAKCEPYLVCAMIVPRWQEVGGERVMQDVGSVAIHHLNDRALVEIGTIGSPGANDYAHVEVAAFPGNRALLLMILDAPGTGDAWKQSVATWDASSEWLDTTTPASSGLATPHIAAGCLRSLRDGGFAFLMIDSSQDVKAYVCDNMPLDGSGTWSLEATLSCSAEQVSFAFWPGMAKALVMVLEDVSGTLTWKQTTLELSGGTWSFGALAVATGIAAGQDAAAEVCSDMAGGFAFAMIDENGNTRIYRCDDPVGSWTEVT